VEVLDLERDGKVCVHLDGSMGVGVSRLEVIEGPSGRRRRTKAERARIAAESMISGVTVADIARRYGTTRWQIYDWRKQLRKGNLMVPESVASLPVFAELMVDDSAAAAPARGASDVEIVIGDIVIRSGAGADEGQLTRAIRAARAAAS
jgi:transposase